MSQILQLIKKYVTLWWIPLAAYSFAVGIFFLGISVNRDWLIYFAFIVFFINMLATIISSVVQIGTGKWYFIFPQLGVTALLCYCAGIVMGLSPLDYYGTLRTIPDDIHFAMPLDSLPTSEDYEKHDFILINDFQPGLYLYQSDHRPDATGHFYVQAYEINSNDRLSGERMKERSKVIVDDLEVKLWQGAFTIYEGDWGDRYGSRMELWYHPDNGEEYMVEERFFIIAGWQR
jgi:hypothetical protein